MIALIVLTFDQYDTNITPTDIKYRYTIIKCLVHNINVYKAARKPKSKWYNINKTLVKHKFIYSNRYCKQSLSFYEKLFGFSNKTACFLSQISSSKICISERYKKQLVINFTTGLFPWKVM